MPLEQRPPQLNRWRRIGSLVSGHAEGWARYAERLMVDSDISTARLTVSAHSRMAEPVLRYELDRYLGWPGQAPSYKIGERHWLQLRDQARAAQGAAFDLKSFHRRVLDIGSVGLDVLQAAVLHSGARQSRAGTLQSCLPTSGQRLSSWVAGPIARVAGGDIKREDRTVLLHTGGLPGLVGHPELPRLTVP